MAFNFNEIIATETKKQEESNSLGSGGLGFKTVYPFSNGRLEFRLIGNEPSGLLYRELMFHEYWSDNKKQKVPCLHQMYGMDCPICNAVSNVQNTLDDKDIFKKYGFKKQGIMFAKLINVSPDNYFGETKNPAKPGDIVLFMFPKSVINELRNLIVEYSEDLENIFTNNSARTVTLKIGTQANGFPEYAFYVKGTNDVLKVDMTGAPDQAAFNEFMSKLPNLNEVKFPSAANEDMMKIHRTIVEEINRKYFGDKVGEQPMTSPTPMTNIVQNTQVQTPVNNQPNNVVSSMTSTGQVPPTQINENAAPVSNSVPPVMNTNAASTPITSNEDSRGQRPPCFGNNEYNDKCAACPYDAECV